MKTLLALSLCMALLCSGCIFGGGAPEPVVKKKMGPRLVTAQDLVIPTPLKRMSKRMNWYYQFQDSVSNVWIHDKEIVVLDSKYNIFLVMKDRGVPVWQNVLANRPAYDPYVTSNSVFVIYGNRLTRIDKASGTIDEDCVQQEIGYSLHCAPVFRADPNTMYAGTSDSRIYGIELRKTKDTVYDWRHAKENRDRIGRTHITDKWWHHTKGAAEKMNLFVGKLIQFTDNEGNIYSINSDGKEASFWSFAAKKPINDFYTAPDALYAGSDDFNLYVINPLGGDEVWRYRVGEPVQKVFYADRKPKPKKIVIEKKAPAAPPADGAPAPAPKAAPKAAKKPAEKPEPRNVYFNTTYGRFIALDLRTRKPRWERKGVHHFAAVTPKHVYVVVDRGFQKGNDLLKLDKATGDVLLKIDASAFIFARKHDDTIFMMNPDNVLISLKMRD